MTGESLEDALGDPEHWAAYNQAVRGRPVRQLCTDVLRLAGPGAGRTAVDLGCGTGTEAKALLYAGWNVVAIDSAASTRELVAETVGRTDPGRLTVRDDDIQALGELPANELLFSSLTLPFLAPSTFARVWAVVRQSLLPGGWLAVNLLGDRDSWAPSPAATFLTADAARKLFDELTVVSFEEWEEDRPACMQDMKHWHVLDVIARREPA